MVQPSTAPIYHALEVLHETGELERAEADMILGKLKEAYRIFNAWPLTKIGSPARPIAGSSSSGTPSRNSGAPVFISGGICRPEGVLMGLPRAILIVCALIVTGAAPSSHQVSSTGAAPATGSQAYAFPSGAGLLLFYVRPDRTGDFESVLKRMAEVLDKADMPPRKQQAAGWRMFKSVETPKDSVIYVFVLDPAVAGSDYDPVKVLSEGLPTEAHGLYESLKNATLRIERMGLSKLR